MSKLARGEFVSLKVLVKVCAALKVDIGEAMEIVPDIKFEDKTITEESRRK